MFGQSISRTRLISNTRGWENGTLWHRIVSRISPEKTLHRARGNIEEKKRCSYFLFCLWGKMHFRDWPLSALPIGCLERGDGRFHYWCTSFPPEFSRIIYYQKGFFLNKVAQSFPISGWKTNLNLFWFSFWFSWRWEEEKSLCPVREEEGGSTIALR